MNNFLSIVLIAPLLFFQEPNKNKAKEIIKKAKNDSLVIDAYIQIISGFNTDQNDSIHYYGNKALSYAKKKSYREGLSLINEKIGKHLTNHGSLSEAESYLLAAIQTLEPKKDQLRFADINNYLGIIYGKKGDYELATKKVLQALRIYDELNDLNGKVSSYIKLGTISRLNDDLKHSLNYTKKGQSINKNLKNVYFEIDLLNNEAVFYAMQQDYVNALKIFKDILKKSTQGGPKFIKSRIVALMNIGLIYKEKKQYQEALQYLNKSFLEAEKYNLPNDKVRNQLNIALVLSDQRKFKKSNNLSLIALNIAIEKEFSDISTEALNLLQFNYTELKDYENALKYSHEFHASNNKLKNTKKAKEIANLRSIYELKKSQEQVEFLDKINQKTSDQRDLMVGLIILASVSMVVFGFYYFRIKKLNAEIYSQKNLLIDSNEIKNKIFSIIGHDLRSAYSSTLGFLNLLKDGDLNKKEEELFIGKVITQSQLALETLDNLLLWGHSQIKGTKIVTEVFEADLEIQKNIDFLKDQFQTKNIKVEFTYQIDKKIKADLNHFDFVMRNLLSNAIKFTPENGSIKIAYAKYGQSQVQFTITDNGIGMGKEKIAQIFNADSKSTLGTSQEKGTGLGLMLCREFIELNGGQIWAESEKGEGSKFSFVLNKG
jgi:signal transduction histidine kinase